jgi:hypothetical protein
LKGRGERLEARSESLEKETMNIEKEHKKFKVQVFRVYGCFIGFVKQ